MYTRNKILYSRSSASKPKIIKKIKMRSSHEQWHFTFLRMSVAFDKYFKTTQFHSINVYQREIKKLW